MTQPVAILVPVLNRPHRVRPLLDSITAATPESHSVLFIADPDDHAQIAAVREHADEVLIHGGSYAQKINAGVRATDEPLIFLGADDLDFHPGWLSNAAAHLSDTIGVVGTNDLGNRRVIAGNHATHSLVARWYADLGAIDGGGVLHEGYGHCFVDDELVATAKVRNAWAFAPDSHVEHRHPDWGKGEPDEVYAKGQSTFRLDRKHFQRRSRLWT